MLDLNSIAVGVSPAFSMKINILPEKYAAHLQDISNYFKLPVCENIEGN